MTKRNAKTLWLTWLLVMAALLSVVAEDMQGMSGEGQLRTAREGLSRRASARQQNGDGAGHRARAEKGLTISARPSPQSREAGARYQLPKGHSLRAPAREPCAGAIAAKG